MFYDNEANKMNCAWIVFVFVATLVVMFRHTSGELTLEEIQKANAILMKHCQPTTGVSDEILEASMKGNFADDRSLKCYLACMMGLSHTLKKGQYRAELAIRLADDILPAEIKDRARVVVEKCRNAANGLTDECEMAFAIKKCAYAADPEIYHVQ
ncbi:General odorant-binding protein 72 [Cryptotermes secundus]|uniref:General odorant-binding protein 72 n=1 Tax=Cryptotermes secundus TaxID=105785 RepID=A0A2J7PNE5_9NEOP|nr:general odorant-binding protein 72 [Cryptotermes secundus]PNF17860.1 General odorant-binding protein 72 [Cryptotermes secundus]